jgi:hypothetical protein
MAIAESTDWRTWVVARPNPEPAQPTAPTTGPAVPQSATQPAKLVVAPDPVTEVGTKPHPLDLARQQALLCEWAGRAYLAQLEHAVAAAGYNRLNRTFGIPAVAATTFVGASVVTSLAETDTPGVLTMVVIGAASAVGATLTALQTFFNHASAASSHQRFWAEYECVLRRIEMLRGEVPSGAHIAPIEAESAARYLRGRMRDLEEYIELTTAPT